MVRLHQVPSRFGGYFTAFLSLRKDGPDLTHVAMRGLGRAVVLRRRSLVAPRVELSSSRDHSVGASASGTPSNSSLAPTLARAPLGISAHDTDRKGDSLCKADIA